LVFGINTFIFTQQAHKVVSDELSDFSDLLDEQFEIDVLEEETLTDFLLNIFK